mmetsp:Transcript_4796/g.7210  ORF Transcript_4796/g.7210 Transcript_4796/m.7210 type:complete len:557 (+) Transcript_4796:39-1709(+)
MERGKSLFEWTVSKQWSSFMMFILLLFLCFSSCPGLKVIVIGSGVGGLAVAGRLRKETGVEVTVLEKNSKFGGRVGEHLMDDKFRFETGASLLLLPQVYEKTLRDLSDNGPFETVRVDPSYAVWIGSDEPIEIGGSSDAVLKTRLDAEAKDGYAKYIEYLECADEYLRAGWPIFIEEDLKRAPELLPRFLLNALIPGQWPLSSHADHLKNKFPDSPALRALCAFNDMYVGLSPHKAPAVFSLLSAIELGVRGKNQNNPSRSDLGVFYLQGGLTRYVDRLVNACQNLGVHLHSNVQVNKIIVDDMTKTATGCETTDGKIFSADYIIVNADLATAEPSLLGSKYSRSNYNKMRYSTSSHTFLWAIDRPLFNLRHHNVFLTPDNNHSDDPFLSGWQWALPDVGTERMSTSSCPSFHFYVCAAARTDPTAAPIDGDAIMILVPTPPFSTDNQMHDDLLAATIRDAVMKRLQQACGPFNIIEERLIAPYEWRASLGLRRGSVFSFDHALDQLAIFRPSRRSSKVKNVAFVGAATRPGNGVPLVLTSAELCAREVAANLRRR